MFVPFGPTKNLLKTPQPDYPLVIPNIAGWNIPVFNRKYIDEPIRGPPFSSYRELLDDPSYVPSPKLPWVGPTFKGTSFCFNSLASSSLKLRRSWCFVRTTFFQGRFKRSIWKTPWEKTHIHPQKLPFHSIFSVNLRDSNWCLLKYLTKNIWNAHTQGFAKDAWMIWIETACIHRQVNAMCDRENPRRTGWPRVISQGDSTNLVRIESLGTSNSRRIQAHLNGQLILKQYV